MATKCLKYSFVSGVTVTSFFLGSLLEQKRAPRQKNLDFGEVNAKRLPALPVFGTVSAASPISPSVLPSAGSSDCLIHISRLGYPSFDQIREFDNYILSYDRRNRIAHWVFEHITPEKIKKNESVDRTQSEFRVDEKLHPYFRSENTDYKRSGYDRGHLAAAGNYKSNQKHLDETFYLSNMTPQVGTGFNRDTWNRLERHVRKLTKHYPNIYCCTGPLFLPRQEKDGKTYVKYQVIGSNHVAVPTHFFKIFVGETRSGSLEMEAYVMPNAAIANDVPLNSFQVPPESIERAAGLLFFDHLSKSRIRKINGKELR